MNSVQTGAVMAHVSRQFESNASRLRTFTRLIRPAKADADEGGFESRPARHLSYGTDLTRLVPGRAEQKRELSNN